MFRIHVVLKSSLYSLLAMLVLAPENVIVVEVIIFSFAMIYQSNKNIQTILFWKLTFNVKSKKKKLLTQNISFQPGQILGFQPVPRQDCPGGEN